MSPVCSSDLALAMRRIRLVEEAIVHRYSEQEMRCPVHLSIGQEAVAVGVCAALTHEDFAVSGHRAHAHYLAKGGDLKRMIAEIYGKETGCCHGWGGSMHLVDLSAGFLGSTPIVAGSLPVGVGAAFGSGKTTAIFFGEGATEEGVFAECLNFATLKQLPILFVCENNLYSVYSPMEVRQHASRDRAAIARAHGMTTFSGDGNNAMEVFRYATEAKALRKPCYLEFATYRHLEHCGPHCDDTLGYRPKGELRAWQEKDPVYSLSDEEEKRLVEEIEDAFTFAKESPFPHV